MTTTTETVQHTADTTRGAPRHRTLARAATDRARSLREQAASIQPGRLDPLRAALLRRAGELELAASVLSPGEPRPTLLAASA